MGVAWLTCMAAMISYTSLQPPVGPLGRRVNLRLAYPPAAPRPRGKHRNRPLHCATGDAMMCQGAMGFLTPPPADLLAGAYA